MNRYEEYKTVDIPWIKEIPNHWKLERHKNILELKKEIIGKDSHKIDVLTLSVTGIRQKKGKNIGKVPETYDTYQIINKNDLVLCLFDLDVSAVFSDVSNYIGIISPAYSRFEINSGYPKFYKYVFDKIFQDRSYKVHSKSVRYTVSNENFLALTNIVPPIEEQIQIANYLDWKINEIDRLIQIEKNKKQQIEQVLQFNIDYRLQVIDDKTGIRLKYLANHVTRRSDTYKRYIALENIISKKGIMNISFKELGYSNDGIMAEKNMVIFGKLRPYLAKAIVIEDDAICSSEFIVLESIKMNPLYLKYLMLSSSFVDLVNQSTYGTKMPRANAESILNIKINIPTIDKQIETVNEIQSIENTTNYTLGIIDKKINHLKQLKQSLISEVVTGQIDIRNVVIPEYEKVSQVEIDEEYEDETLENEELEVE